MTNVVAGGCSSQRLVPRLHEAVWKTINLSENTLPLIVKQADRQSDEIFGFFYGDKSKN